MHPARQVSRRRPWNDLRRAALGTGALAAAISMQLAADAQAPPSDSLEEITVTARRVEENLQDTPLAVSVFSGDDLTERQIFETTELDFYGNTRCGCSGDVGFGLDAWYKETQSTVFPWHQYA